MITAKIEMHLHMDKCVYYNTEIQKIKNKKKAERLVISDLVENKTQLFVAYRKCVTSKNTLRCKVKE